MPAQLLKVTRQVHLYLGVFIAPMLLFFAFTGALQTFSLHETTRGSDYKPPQWAVTLAQLHKKQNIAPSPKRPVAPEVKAAKPTKSPDAAAPGAALPGTAAPAATPPKPKSHLPEKIFFLLVSVGLFTSTLTGIYMAYKYNRNKWIVTGLLLAGVILPIALLPF
jgi:hypothetical protein